MKIIETSYDGHRFRSRTEARWAVFFNKMGWAYEYEKEGYALDGKPYLPDFYLPEFKRFVEIKGDEPTAQEIDLCLRLAQHSRCPVLMAVGAPRGGDQIVVITPDDDVWPRSTRFFFAEDRRNEGEFWLVSARDGAGMSIGPKSGPNHGRAPVVSDRIKAAYDAAGSARFEHGEKPEGRGVS